MPLIKIQTSVTSLEPTKVESMLKSFSTKLAKHTGKPESYIMTSFESDVAMTFAGTTEPVCYVEIKSIGQMKPEQTVAMSQDFCQEINQIIGVPQNRIYIEFADGKGSMWGWNGTTFG
jgi:phenylpyruvate tautomerase